VATSERVERASSCFPLLLVIAANPVTDRIRRLR